MADQQTVKERLKALMESRGWSENELARRSGVPQPTIHRILTGESKSPRAGNLQKLATALGVSASALTYGDAPASDHPQHDVDHLATPELTDDNAPLGLDEVELPYYREVELEGGDGRTQVIENHGRSMRFPVDKLLRAGVNPDQAACATLVGNSMEPKIMDGSPIAIDRGCTQIIDGKIYAIDHGGMLRVKRLYRLPLNRIRIASENSDEHPDEIVSPPELEELRIIGRVFWWESFD